MGLFNRFSSQKGKAEKAAPKTAAKVSATKKEAQKETFKAVPAAAEAKKPTSDTPVTTTRQATGDAYRILLSVVVTEKSARLEQAGQYVFMIAPSATKKTVAEAIKKVYGVWPEDVNIVNLPGKWVRYGRTTGQQMPRRKAIVTVPAGKEIDLTS